MARKLRVQYEGAIYHVMNRAIRRQAIFRDEEDRERFLNTLGGTCEKTGHIRVEQLAFDSGRTRGTT